MLTYLTADSLPTAKPMGFQHPKPAKCESNFETSGLFGCVLLKLLFCEGEVTIKIVAM